MLNGNSKTLRPCKGKFDLIKSKLRLAIAIDLNKCRTQIKLSISLYECAHISQLPSNVCTMCKTNPNMSSLCLHSTFGRIMIFMTKGNE